jgi:NAD+ synthase
MNCKNFEKRIIVWLKRKIKDAKKKGIVLGLSGGIDSSVVAVLCKKAIGNKNLLCILLPCQSQKIDIIDAKKVAKKFDLNIKTIDLTNVYQNFLKVLPEGNKLSLANIKPRLRMLTLYYFANNLNYIVAGTGNKSELSVGYFTKYGDGGVDILPIGNLYKSEVRAMAKYLNIPSEIIKKPPTAGLWAGQTDEDEMGMTYDYLEYSLKNKKLNKKLKQYVENAKHKLCLPETFK